MKIGLNIPDFTWPGGPTKLGSTLAQIARTADHVGFQSISVMDHFWQIGRNGPPEHDMLEGYTALAFMAGFTARGGPGALRGGAPDCSTRARCQSDTVHPRPSGGLVSIGV